MSSSCAKVRTSEYLDVDSVMNVETDEIRFIVHPDMSREEIQRYLENVYGIDDIEAVNVKNFAGEPYRNEIGAIKQTPPYKMAYVKVENPVSLQIKQVKGTEDQQES